MNKYLLSFLLLSTAAYAGVTKIESSDSALDTTKVLKAGDTMTGDLNMSGAAVILTGSAGVVTSGSSITASAFFGDGANVTGVTAATNANLTGPVTSVGNATTIVGPVPQSAVNLSTVTTALNGKSDIGNPAHVDLSTVTTALNGKSAIGNPAHVDLSTVTTALNLKVSLAGAETITGAKDFRTISSSLTVQGNGFSVGLSTLAISSGFVGIGSASPGTKLHVSSGTVTIDGSGAAIELTGALQMSDDQQINWGAGQTAIQGNDASDFIDFYTAATVGMRLNSSKNVGIGTTSPVTRLHVHSTADQSGLTVENSVQSPTIRLNQPRPVVSSNERDWGIITSHTNYGDFMLRVSSAATASPFSGVGSLTVIEALRTGDVAIATNTASGTQLFYCAGGTFDGNLCRGAACICTGGTATALGIYVR